MHKLKKPHQIAEDKGITHSAGEGHVPAPFIERYRRALKDMQQRRNLLNFQRNWRVSRDTVFADYKKAGNMGETYGEKSVPTSTAAGNFPAETISGGQALEEKSSHGAAKPGSREFVDMSGRLAAIKDEVIANQPEYLAQFIANARANGIKVYEAATAEQACQYVYNLCREKGIDVIVKSKSMVSEEIGLNAMLEEHGIHPVETDLGEWIAQLSNERPSHMVLPIIHKSRQQVGQLFTDVTHHPVSLENVDEQVKVARQELRQDFLKAGMGISGANALIAESGAVMFIENEGNARLVTTLPRVHVVLAGIEKLLPDYAAAMLQLRLLARSATAQPITSYSSFVNGPTEPDKEMHIVLLDNGRRTMRARPEFREALRCIRCAACANICPPYQVVGGHVFGYIYSGAIGLVNTPFHHGIDAAAGPQSLCVSCNACATVCPVQIPLPRQILDVRAMVTQAKGLPWYKRPVIWLWSKPKLFDAVARAGTVLQYPLADSKKPFLNLQRIRLGTVKVPLPRLSVVETIAGWRSLPALGKRPGRDLVKERLGQQPKPLVESAINGKTVAYFIQCFTDRLFPDMAAATTEVLQALGAKVVMPEQQHCCGLPALDSGDRSTAKKMAQQTIQTLETALANGADYIVTGGASCAIAVIHDYHHLFREDTPEDKMWRERASKVATRTYDFVSFMSRVAKLPYGALAPEAGAETPAPVTYHNFCQSGNVMKLVDEPRTLIKEVLGLELVEMNEANVCCGFGGSVSADRPEMSSQVLARKLENITATGVSTVVTDNPGCIMHMRGGADAQGLPFRVLHIAELFAERVRALKNN
ncbi:MAG TPA: LUD domain-containing protein [Chloroflexia bacterium]|nr:LUD domain-containing protein [Chloroflexia bacterium]